MPLLQLLVILIVIGVALYLINNFIPMDAKIKAIINVLAVILVCVWLLDVFNILPNVSGIRIVNDPR